MRFFLFRFILTFGVTAIALNATVAAPTPADLARWQEHARKVTIIRDTWGIAHVFGQTDANTVFGLLYAQAEDDFNRIELNYVNALGRLAEIEGEKELYRDLRMKLFIDPVELRAQYATSPAWLRALMDAFADGLNFYLHTHPGVRPKLITHFEPWMALAFTEGSIGGDIESVSLKNLEAFYGSRPALAFTAPDRAASDAATAPAPPEAQGSNGFAIAPAKSASGHALLLINPHTSFYYRPEVHAVSAEGLNAYGAATWGQFFVYQGFNDRLGWMHTSNGADVIDEYRETVVPTPAGPTCCDEGGCCACRCCALPIAICARIVAREILLDSRTSGRKVISGIRPSALQPWDGSRLRSPRCWTALTGSTACGMALARVACSWHQRLDTISRMATIDSRASMVSCPSLRIQEPCDCAVSL